MYAAKTNRRREQLGSKVNNTEMFDSFTMKKLTSEEKMLKFE